MCGTAMESSAGLPAKIFRPEHLLANFLKVNRPKDRLKCQPLLESGILDPGHVDEITARHGLVEQWSRGFGSRIQCSTQHHPLDET
jgi:hypothetical protein